MNIPVNPIGVPPEGPKEVYKNVKREKPAEKIRPNTPDNVNKKFTPKQKMQIKIRRVKEKKPKQPILLGGIAILLALFFLLGNISLPVAVPNSKDYENQGIQFTFLGDVMPGRYIQIEGQKKGYNQIYDNVKNVWKNSDYVFANLESAVLTSKTAKYKALDKNILLATDKEAVASMYDAGINAISFANNHSGDYGKKSFNSAMKWFNKNDIAFAGYIDREAYNASKEAADESAEKYKPYTQLKVDGKKIGFISVTDSFHEKNLSYGLLTTSNSDLNSYINQSALENDITVVYAHWGEEYTKKLEADQKTLAHQFIDAGADIVIGSHPHVLQPIETYKDGIVFYSIGNFVMDQNNTFTCDSVIVQYNENKDGVRSIELIPVRIKNGIPSVTNNPLYEFRIKRVLTSQLDKSLYTENESGNIVINY